MQHGCMRSNTGRCTPKKYCSYPGRVVESSNGRSLPHVVAFGDPIASLESA
jgi:hypothetical protein